MLRNGTEKVVRVIWRKWCASQGVGWVLVGLLVLIAIARVMATYDQFSHTYDEPTHIYAGLQILDTGKYTFHNETPPIARMLLAVGPYLSGARASYLPESDPDLRVLYAAKSYGEYMFFARFGNVPFLLLLIVGSSLWAGRVYGTTAAVVCAFTLAMLSPILGHAGLATTDVACAATVVTTLYVFIRWIESRSWILTLMLGISSGVAVMVKFSAIPFLISSIVAIIGWRAVVGGLKRRAHRSKFENVSQLFAVAVVIIGVFWLSYGLLDPLQTAVIHENFELSKIRAKIEPVIGKNGPVFEMARRLITEVPFPIFVRNMALGLNMLVSHNAQGHWSYLFGEMSMSGWWYYYIVELAVKTPVPIIILGLFGFFHIVQKSLMKNDWRVAVPLLCFVGILIVVSTTSRINSGVRHILVLYPLITIAIGALIADFYTRRNFRMLSVSVILLAWYVGGSALVHPDYIADFNVFAGDKPERILIDSDLDWGQDLKRLEQQVTARNIERLSVAYYGKAEIGRHIKNYKELKPFSPVTGWVAVSKTIIASSEGGYGWLNKHKPVVRVGRTIDLYFVNDDKRSSMFED